VPVRRRKVTQWSGWILGMGALRCVVAESWIRWAHLGRSVVRTRRGFVGMPRLPVKLRRLRGVDERLPNRVRHGGRRVCSSHVT
jgi:hypothetical protein